MFKKIDFLIYVEHRVRELDSAKNIYRELIRLGYSGEIISVHYDKYINVLKYNPKVVIVPFCHNKNDDFFEKFEKLYGSKVIKVNTHEEQITDNKGLEIMMPSDEYAKNIIHICWGQVFKDYLIDNGVPEELTYVTGSPRMDLIINNNYICKEELAKEFNLDYKKQWLVIPMNFSLVFVGDEYIKNIAMQLSDDIYSRVEVTKRSMEAFFNVLGSCVSDLKDFEVILRPHPYEDINNYNKYIEKYNLNMAGNLKVIRKYSVTNWFKVSDKIITWTSTSAIEAAAMKKDIALLIPENLPEKYIMDFFKYLPVLKNEDELQKFLKITMSKGKIEEYMTDNYYKIDGESYKRIANVISNNIYGEQSNNISLKEVIRCMSNIIKKDIPKRILYKVKLLDTVKSDFKGLLDDYIVKKDYM